MIDLKGKKVFILTRPELGWDCVCGAFLANSKDEVIEYMGENYTDDYLITQEDLTIIQSKSEIRDEKIEEIIN